MRHERTEPHKDSVTEREQRAGLRSGMNEAMSLARVKVAGLWNKLLLVGFVVATNSIALWHFESNVELLEACDAIPEANGHSYSHARYFWACLWAMSEACLRMQLERINDSPYYSIMMDSSAAMNKQDHMLIFVQYFCLSDWQVHTEYLCCVHVNSKTAETAYSLCCNVLQCFGISLDKMCGFCADGGSEFAGCNKGCGVLLKSEIPWLILMHCAPHKFSLALVEQTNMKSPYKAPILTREWLGYTDVILRKVHGIFSHSTKRVGEWTQFAQPRGVVRFKFPLFVVTRWLSRYDCLVVLCNNLAVFIIFCRCFSALSAVCVILECQRTCRVLMAMRDVMHIFNIYSKELQANSMMAHEVRPTIDRAVAHLRSLVYMTRDKDAWGNAVESVPTGDFDKIWMPSYDSFHSRVTAEGVWVYSAGQQITLTCDGNVDEEDPHMEVMHLVHQLATGFAESLERRFPDALIMRSFRVFDPAFYIGLSFEDLQSHKTSIDEFKYLMGHFCSRKASKHFFPDCPKEDGEERKAFMIGMMAEFKAARLALRQVVEESPKISMLHAWQRIVMTRGALFPRVIKFVYVCFSLPIQSAVVERGFSNHRGVMSRMRSKLKITTVDSLMRMVLVSPRKIADWQRQLSALTVEILGIMGTRATAGASGDCPPLLKKFWAATAAPAFELPDDQDELFAECEEDFDEGFGVIAVADEVFVDAGQVFAPEVDETAGM